VEAVVMPSEAKRASCKSRMEGSAIDGSSSPLTIQIGTGISLHSVYVNTGETQQATPTRQRCV
jgi:hypothetical protein